MTDKELLQQINDRTIRTEVAVELLTEKIDAHIVVDSKRLDKVEEFVVGLKAVEAEGKKTRARIKWTLTVVSIVVGIAVSIYGAFLK